MNKKLTISIDEQVYNGLYAVVGERKISHFIEELVRPHVLRSELAAAYHEMAHEGDRDDHALEWSEGLVGDHAA